MLEATDTAEEVAADRDWESVPALPEPQDRDAGPASWGPDPEALFAADLSGTALLSAADEEALGQRIARARRRIRTILRQARRLSDAALASGGRGVVRPDVDFRERETVAVLRFAEAALRGRSSTQRTGMPRPRLRRFVTELRHALAEYRDLRDQMIRANVRLVNVLARRYRHPTLTFLDRFQEGAMGLFRAVEKYDPNRKIKFSTYATWWIWQQLGRAGDTQGAIIRTPVHWNQLRRRLGRRVAAATVEGPPSPVEVAQIEGIDRERLEAMGQSFRFVSTDTPVSDDDDRALESIMPSSAPQPEEHVMHSALRTHLERVLETLPPRERLILRERFGLDDDASQTLDEIGTRLGVSRERVRQLESRALHKLRELCAAEGLHEYLN
jgi:RNA polymerase primary sigma factor